MKKEHTFFGVFNFGFVLALHIRYAHYLITFVQNVNFKAMDWISKAVDAHFDDVVNYRRTIHQNPELSFQEYSTAQFIQDKLSDISFKRVCDTGLLALIEPLEKSENEPCIALRADIDALPIQEETNLEFASVNAGVMHACGHDMHAAILMGVSKIIVENREKLRKKVKLVFQLGEEKLPGGASMMIDAGILENPKVDQMYGLHVFPDLESGKIGFRSGPYMASCDEIYLTIHGVGGHAALPHKTVDPIFIAAQIIVQAQAIVSRHADPTVPSVLSFGHIEGLGATNVIPSKVVLKGTFRTMDEAWRNKAHQLLRDLVYNICQSHGAQANLTIEVGYPFLVNDENATNYARLAVSQLFESEDIIDLSIRMTAEDFSYYSQKVPATFFRIGVKKPNSKENYGLHNSRFNPDEQAMKYGMKALLSIVFS